MTSSSTIRYLTQQFAPLIVMLGACCAWPASVAAQTNYSGLVTDPDGQPLQDVMVFHLVGSDDVEPTWQSTLSGPQGEFTLPSSLPDFKPESSEYPFIGFKEGWAVEGNVDVDRDRRQIRIKLSRPTPRAVRVVSPMGEPVAGAAVMCIRLNTRGSGWGSAWLPESLSRKLTFETDDQGIVRPAIATGDQRPGWAVISKRFGRQEPEHRMTDRGTELHLSEVGRVTGQVIADDPQVVKNLKVLLGLGPDFDLRTDETGRFEVPVHPVGELWVGVEVDPLFPYRLPEFVIDKLKPNETTHIKLTLRKGFRVRGQVVDAASAKPVPGTYVFPSGPGFDDELKTDANGMYEFFALPGEFDFSLLAPAGYFSPRGFRTVELKAEDTATMVDTIRLKRGVELRGSVVDEKGRPVGNAEVTAAWLPDDARALRTSIASTSENGGFVLSMIEPDVKIQIAAASKSRGSVQLQAVDSSNARELRLPVRAAGVRHLQGRVVDSSGRPMDGVRVELVRRVPFPRQSEKDAVLQPLREGTFDVELEETSQLVTDDQGIFRSPHPLSILSAYAVKVAGDGVFPQQYPLHFAEPRDDGAAWLQATTASRVMMLRGRVVGQDDKPLEGAQVFAHSAMSFPDYTTADTDSGGDFVLESVHGDARFMFADKEGYRFGGTVIEQGEQLVKLLPRDAPVPAEARRTWKGWTAEQRREMLGRFRVPLLEILAFSYDDIALGVATYRPDIVEQSVEDSISFTFRNKVALLLARNEIDKAVEVLEAVDASQPYSGVIDWFLLAADQAKGAEEKLGILKRAARHTRKIPTPLRRLESLAHIVDRLLLLKQESMARQAVQEGITVAKSIPLKHRQEFLDSWFKIVASFAAVDLPAAMKLTEGIKADTLSWGTWAHIAHRIADKDPAAAERLLNKEDRITRRHYLARVCQSMANSDLTRAMRLIRAEEDGNTRAYAMGRVASQLVKDQPQKARELLHEGAMRPKSFYANEAERPLSLGVEIFGSDDGGSVDEKAFQTTARLARIAETVDPDAVSEYVWKAIMRHPGPRTRGYNRDPAELRMYMDRQTAQLAAFLALYDVAPSITRELIEPVFERAAKYDIASFNRFHESQAVLISLALADPDRASALLQSDLLRARDQFGIDQKEVIHAWIKLYTANEFDFWATVFDDVLD